MSRTQKPWFFSEELDEEGELTERSDWNDDKGLKHDGEKWKINEMDEMLSYKTKLVIACEREEKKKKQESEWKTAWFRFHLH